ncbi:unnamed protein product, partial [marine sediment metagenome]
MDLAGLSVAEIQLALRDVLNVGQESKAYLNGKRVNGDAIARLGDRLEFMRSSGRKGYFSYFGSKSKIVKYYSPPTRDPIIEPFAGSARYALRYWDHDVWVNDSYPAVFNMWNYLQQATPSDINSLPDLKKGDKIPKSLSPEEQLLMGFAIGRGNAYPRKTTTGWGEVEIPRMKKRALDALPK